MAVVPQVAAPPMGPHPSVGCLGSARGLPSRTRLSKGGFEPLRMDAVPLRAFDNALRATVNMGRGRGGGTDAIERTENQTMHRIVQGLVCPPPSTHYSSADLRSHRPVPRSVRATKSRRSLLPDLTRSWNGGTSLALARYERRYRRRRPRARAGYVSPTASYGAI